MNEQTAHYLNPQWKYHPAESHLAGVQEFYQRQIKRGLRPRSQRKADLETAERLMREGRL